MKVYTCTPMMFGTYTIGVAITVVAINEETAKKLVFEAMNSMVGPYEAKHCTYSLNEVDILTQQTILTDFKFTQES